MCPTCSEHGVRAHPWVPAREGLLWKGGERLRDPTCHAEETQAQRREETVRYQQCTAGLGEAEPPSRKERLCVCSALIPPGLPLLRARDPPGPWTGLGLVPQAGLPFRKDPWRGACEETPSLSRAGFMRSTSGAHVVPGEKGGPQGESWLWPEPQVGGQGAIPELGKAFGGAEPGVGDRGPRDRPRRSWRGRGAAPVLHRGPEVSMELSQPLGPGPLQVLGRTAEGAVWGQLLPRLKPPWFGGPCPGQPLPLALCPQPFPSGPAPHSLS